MAPGPGRDEACPRSAAAGPTDHCQRLHKYASDSGQQAADSRGRGNRQSVQITPAGDGNTRDYRESLERREWEEMDPPPSTAPMGRLRLGSFKPFSEWEEAFLRGGGIGAPGSGIHRSASLAAE